MTQCCKVGTLVQRYGVESASSSGDVDDYLVRRWVGRGEYTSTGLRPLKDWLNKQALKQAYTDHNRDTLDSRIDAEYSALTGSDADFAVLDDLSADGIDGEQLRSDFVSTATLYRHLTDCCGANKSADDEPSTSEWERDKLDYARTVVEQSLGESLRSLDTKGRLPGGSRATIKTEVVVGCPDCGTQVSFERALKRGYICQDHMGEAEPGIDG